ncbi:hypothetical protein B566_EDAN006268 [Ephemera danica]|nr:hypothetical protein B566_EDAN006268 [Ephemera danica]
MLSWVAPSCVFPAATLASIQGASVGQDNWALNLVLGGREKDCTDFVCERYTIKREKFDMFPSSPRQSVPHPWMKCRPRDEFAPMRAGEKLSAQSPSNSAGGRGLALPLT